MFEELGRGVDHPLTVSFIIQMTPACEEEEQVVHANRLLMRVQALEQTKDLKRGHRGSYTVLHSVGKGRREGEGVIAGGDEDGRIGSHGNTFLEAFYDTLEGENLGKSKRLLICGEFDSHGVEIG